MIDEEHTQKLGKDAHRFLTGCVGGSLILFCGLALVCAYPYYRDTLSPEAKARQSSYYTPRPATALWDSWQAERLRYYQTINFRLNHIKNQVDRAELDSEITEWKKLHPEPPHP